MEDKWLKEYGNVFVWYFGCMQSITVKDQDILKAVLIKDFSQFCNRKLLDTSPSPLDKGIFFLRDTDWKRVRSIMNPTFSSSKLRTMSDDINKCARNLAENLLRCTEIDESIEIKDYYGAFTIDVISMTAFGLDVDSQRNSDNQLIHHMKKIFNNASVPIPVFLCAIFGDWMMTLLKYLKICFYPRDSMEFFNREVRMMIEERKRNPTNRTDFLQLMIKASLEIPDANANEKAERKMLSTDEIIGQAFLFFLAGYETTASLLSFTAYEMVCNPDVQDRIYEEIVEQLGDEEPTYDNIGKLKYMELVLNETLRLYPTLSRINREAAKTIEINGVTIPKGSAVTIPIRALHQDPETYPEPTLFKPERFIDFKPNQNNINFLPFGHGPRMCIGMRLALMEAKIAVTHVLRHVRFVQAIDTEIPITLKDMGLTVPKTPIRLKVKPRKA
ncbi:cytochrome P450 3A9-like [Mizuhopecten yessoensis]|uniref:Cytochrome P450 3A9 n=1 Tax=Mizuhopecten yessoensis TaxID=6573 RepID=A0A210PHJ4_MIZYE|nr:cytochrome P450 3A9-like [Mizuhopecten yessoensis]OWF35896.1 Cytochrome P450 3A9 [Mizuhopecten yessoensis]